MHYMIFYHRLLAAEHVLYDAVFVYRYGIHLKQLTMKPEDAEERLTHLLKKCGYYLQQQQRPSSNTRLGMQHLNNPFSFCILP